MRFYRLSLFNLFFPILFHILALRELYLAIKSKTKPSPFKLLMSIVFLAVGFMWGVQLAHRFSIDKFWKN